jgi:hypothetical protein
MAGGYGYAGANQDVALTGSGAKFAPVGGGIGTPGAGSYTPYSTGLGYAQPFTGQPQGQPNQYGQDPRAIAANPQGYQNHLQGARTQETNMPGSTFLGQPQGQPQSNIGGGPQTQPLAPVSSTNYNTYGNNMPVGFRYGGGIRSLKYNG